MDDRKPSRPSLLLAGREKAHREHQHQHQIYHNKRQTSATAAATDSTVTQVVATISVVQQINVDSNGSTIASQTTLPTSAASISFPNPSALLTAILNSGSAVTSTIVGEPPLPSAVPSHSFPPSQSIDSASTSALSTSSFASFVVTANSTNLILSSSSSTRFSNSSTSSTSPSSSSTLFSAFLSSSSSSTGSDSSSTSSTSATSSTFFVTQSTVLVTSTAPAGVAGNAATGAVPTNTSASGDGGSESSSTQSTPVIVGGVVGGVAGAALLIFLLMAFIRWKKRHQSMHLLREDAPTSSGTTRGESPPSQSSGAMVERRSRAFAMPSFPNIGGFNRSSRQTERTVSSAEGSEKGFYRVSGRKLPSVLQHGGDGYGGDLPESHTLSGSTFYRDSEGFYGGFGSPTSGSAPRDRDSGIPVMRPSPARTPVTEHAFPYPAVPAPLVLPRRPDLVGRSHSSQDGSHASRFTEEV